MKIVLIGPVYPYRGGIAHYTTLLCRALRAGQNDVLMVSFSRQYPQWLFPGASDRDPSHAPLEIDDARYWLDSINPLSWLITFWRIARFGPQIVVFPWWTAFLAPLWITLSAFVRIFLRRPLVIVCHNVIPHDAHWLDRTVARGVLAWAQRLIVQSADEQRRLASLLPGKPVSIVPHPVYDMFAGQVISCAEARQQLGLDQQMPVLLFFGMVRKYKGLRQLLLAMPEIRTRLGPVRLVIAGEFWEERAAYQAIIEQLDISDAVLIEDRYIPNEVVATYFRAADLLVAPYERMTGSGVVQMAVGFGLPVVTTVAVPLTSERERQLLHLVGHEGLAAAVVEAFLQQAQSPAPANLPADTSDGWAQLVACIEGVCAP